MDMKKMLGAITKLQGTGESIKTVPVAATGKKILNESSKTGTESVKLSLKSIFNTMLSEADQVTTKPLQSQGQFQVDVGDETKFVAKDQQSANMMKQKIEQGDIQAVQETDDDGDWKYDYMRDKELDRKHDEWYIRIDGKTYADNRKQPVPFSNEGDARAFALKMSQHTRTPLSSFKLTKSQMDAKTVTEGKMKELDMDLKDKTMSDTEFKKKYKMTKAEMKNELKPSIKKESKMKNTYEAKKAKPDFLDLDKDGDKKESMKKAAADKKKKTVNEISTDTLLRARNKASGLAHDAENNNHYTAQSARLAQADKFQQGINDRLKKEKAAKEKDSLSPAQRRKLGVMEGANPSEAARLLGKAHALAKDSFSCKYEEGTQEAQAYLDGYKEGLDECYGSSNTSSMPALVPGMDAMGMSQDISGDDFEEDVLVGDTTFDTTDDFGSFDDQDSSADIMAFEAWDKQLNTLLNENSEVSEGVTVAINKDIENAPDSVTVTAQGDEADQLLAMIKQAGMGLFGGDDEQTGSYGAPMAPDANTPATSEVGDHDLMMSLLQKMTTGSQDYEDEVSMDDEQVPGHPDAACDTHGSATREGGACSSGSKETVMGEEESEDQMEYEVAEDNAPDSDETETTADEDTEAEEDKALAGADSGDEEELDEAMSYNSRIKQIKHPATQKSYDDMYARRREAEAEADKKQAEKDKALAGADSGDEEELDESNQSAADMVLAKVGSGELDAYDVMSNPKNPAQAEAAEIIQSMYNDVSINHGLHPDDDFEKIMDIVADQLGSDYGDREELDEELDEDDKQEELNEWANDANNERKEDDSYYEDIDFMTRVISGGLNNQKKNQTTLPHTEVSMNCDDLTDWKKLSGL